MITDVLRQLKNEMSKSFSPSDQRAKIQDSDFIIGLIQAIAASKDNFSLAELRRRSCSFLGVHIGQSAFNERLGTASLVQGLQTVLGIILAMRLEEKGAVSTLKKKLGVDEIIGVDSSMVSLWDGLCNHFRGTFVTAALKLNLGMNLVSGAVKWFQVTEGAAHDSGHFPCITAGSLYIFDLGYWSVQRAVDIDNSRAFFLSRVKSNLRLTVTHAIYGIGKSAEGMDLLKIPIRRKRKSVIEVTATLLFNGKGFPFRVLGFWNKKEKEYRWYITNLTCKRDFIYSTYRLRWQIELSFKAMKSTLNFDRMPTTNPNTVTSLSLVCLINYALSMILRDTARRKAARLPDKACSASILRAAKVFSGIAGKVLEVIKLSRRITGVAMKKVDEFILPLLEDIFDPNYKTRKTTIKSIKCQKAYT